MKVMGIAIVVDVLGMFLKGLKKKLEELEIKGRIETIYILKIKLLGDLRRLVVTQISVKK